MVIITVREKLTTTDCLSKIELRSFIIGKAPDTEQFQITQSIDHFNWESWCPVNKEGQFYCQIDGMKIPERSYSFTLRLDMQKRSWAFCAGSIYEVGDNNEVPSRMLFHCGSVLYRHWRSGRTNIDSKSGMFYLGETASVQKTIKFSPDYIYDRLKHIHHYTVFPYHILLGQE